MTGEELNWVRAEEVEMTLEEQIANLGFDREDLCESGVGIHLTESGQKRVLSIIAENCWLRGAEPWA